MKIMFCTTNNKPPWPNGYGVGLLNRRLGIESPYGYLLFSVNCFCLINDFIYFLTALLYAKKPVKLCKEFSLSQFLLHSFFPILFESWLEVNPNSTGRCA